MVSRARFIVGIDLGTTHTVVAFADTSIEEPVIESLPIEQLVAPGEIASRSMLPSVRYHAAPGELAEHDRTLPWGLDPHEFGQRTVVGQLALSLGSKVPGRFVSSAKSWLSHSAVDRQAAILPWGAPDDVQKISPVDASASYLRHIRSSWDHAHANNPLHEQEVVLTVPASFDEAARALTLSAAKDAGLPKLRLVEEPQAAFYDWLDRRRDDLEEQLEGTKLALVVDVGGGTTDLTLIQIELRESGPRLTRLAVGDHLMLGGDNMDLAVARTVEPRVQPSGQMSSAKFSQLLQQCRRGKEELLQTNAPDAFKVTMLGGGSKLIGGAKSVDVSREEVERLVLDGFFPKVAADDLPKKRRGAIVEFGLPYVADAAVTRHVAQFLKDNEGLARTALGVSESEGPAIPDAVLLNGGVFRGQSLADRLVDVLADWRGSRPKLFANESPELAVARGAVAYGLARRGVGLRIGGGSARSYFLAVDEGQKEAESRKGVCILPRGTEEGEDVLLKERSFSLRLGEPVRFPLVSSAQDVRHHSAGDLVSISGDTFVDLPPLAAVLEDARDDKSEVTVQLVSGLTEVGTLELGFIGENKGRWKLEFQLRGESKSGGTERVTQLHPRFEEATDLIGDVYGKASNAPEPRNVKTLRPQLEKVLRVRTDWDTPLLRELFGALLAGKKRRRRSHSHERVWFNLVGYCLRPGFGYPLDEWRVKQLWELFKSGVQYMPETQNQIEWWILWRRVAGGLTAEMQESIANDLEWYLHPPTKRPRKRPGGPKWTAYDDMVRLAASLENLGPDRKVKFGDWLIERLTKHDERPQTWWAVGRIGARVPFYGSAHNVVPRGTAERWLSVALNTNWDESEQAAFAATLLARQSGDRERDVGDTLRNTVIERLESRSAPESWTRMLTEVGTLDAADERRVFGESLPPGLRLVQ